MSATATMMFNLEENRLRRRDRALAISIAAQMVEEHFRPDLIEDMRDAREQITRAAEHAAYEAIQRERQLHADDMKALMAVSNLRQMVADLTNRGDKLLRLGDASDCTETSADHEPETQSEEREASDSSANIPHSPSNTDTCEDQNAPA